MEVWGGRVKCINSEYIIIMKKEKGFNIDTTKGQYMMLYNIIAEYNPKDADPNFDMQTFDNLFDAICKAKETYL